VNKSVKEVIVLGAGGHAKVVIATLRELEFEVKAVLDDNESKWGKHILGIKIIGPLELIKSGNFEQAVIAIGDNKTRKKIAEKYNGFCRWISIIHPFSYVHPSVEIGEGSVIFAGAVIQPEVVIGKHVIINTSASVDHDCKIEDFVHIAPGVHLAGGVLVGEGSLLGIGSSVVPYKRIGKWTAIGAGSVVINDIQDFLTVVGVPARPIDDK
jgi:sugar O-acyltransferase (sialic acid O-acetyltransferase NeuD family)